MKYTRSLSFSVLLLASVQAEAFPTQLNVTWNYTAAQVQVMNNQGAPIDCSGTLQAYSYNGLYVAYPFYFQSLGVGQSQFASLVAQSFAYAGAAAVADCQFTTPGPLPHDAAPDGTLIASGAITGLNGLQIAGNVSVYEIGPGSYSLRVEDLTGLPREPGLIIQAAVDGTFLGQTYMQASGGSQNFPISFNLPSGVHQWRMMILSTVTGQSYAESSFF